MIGIIYRTFHVFSPPTFHTLHTAMVRPHLDYAYAVWQPYLIRALETVQRRATSLIPDLANLTYIEVIIKSAFTSLQKIKNGMTYKIPRDT